MKKWLFLFLMLFSFNVYAGTCSKEELARLKDIANKVELTYEYKKVYKKQNGQTLMAHYYTVIASNLNKEIKANYEVNYLTGDYEEFKRDSNNMGKVEGFEDGENVVVTIRAYTSDGCSGKELAKKTIKMPYMNPFYYYYSDCEKYPDFKYCKPLVESKISQETFNNELKRYYKIDSGIEEENSEKKVNSNLVLIIVGIVVFLLLLVLAFVITKRKKKNSL